MTGMRGDGDAELALDLAAALRRFSTHFEHSGVPQSLIDLDRRFIAVNDATCRLLGRPREELVGASTSDFFEPPDPVDQESKLRLVRTGEADSASYETTAKRADGTTVPLLVHLSVMRDRSGAPREFATVATDLTELRAAEQRLAQQAAFFEGLDRASSDAAVVFDRAGRVRHISRGFTEILGYEPDQAPQALSFEYCHPDDVQKATDQMAAVLAGPDAAAHTHLRLLHRDGSWRWVDSRAHNRLHDPAIEGVVVNLRDITAEVETQQALRESEMRFRAIAETAQEGIVVVSPGGRVLFANQRLAEILGRSLEEVYAEGDGDEPGPAVDLAGRRPGAPRRFDVSYPHPDGGERVLHVSSSALIGAGEHPLGSLAMVSDVTVERATAQALEHQALHDALTGLPNRTLLMDRLDTAAARFTRSPADGMALLFVDLDHFKDINDQHGHGIGDRVLAEVAARIRAVVRAADTVARLGGDEFAVLCEGTGADDATEVARHVQEAVRRPLRLDGTTLRVSVSIGVALSPPASVSGLLAAADTAMYDAKARGRDRVSAYRSDMDEIAERRPATPFQPEP